MPTRAPVTSPSATQGGGRGVSRGTEDLTLCHGACREAAQPLLAAPRASGPWRAGGAVGSDLLPKSVSTPGGLIGPASSNAPSKWTSSPVPSAQAGGACRLGLPRVPSCALSTCPSCCRRWPPHADRPSRRCGTEVAGRQEAARAAPYGLPTAAVRLKTGGAGLLVGTPLRARHFVPHSWRPPPPHTASANRGPRPSHAPLQGATSAGDPLLHTAVYWCSVAVMCNTATRGHRCW